MDSRKNKWGAAKAILHLDLARGWFREHFRAGYVSGDSVSLPPCIPMRRAVFVRCAILNRYSSCKASFSSLVPRLPW
jgi:hypothetical protein